MRIISALIIFLGTLTLVGADNSPPDVFLDKLSVILISIDTLRADHLGCYGYQRNTSPNLDRFSEKAALFRNAITPRPKTTPAMVSVLTGLYPHTHGVRKLYKPLKNGILTLPEILRDKNYKTAAFVGNWILKKELSGLNQGFEVYNDNLVETTSKKGTCERTAPNINKEVFRWLDENHNEKFFLWIHYQDVHGPYVAPKEYQNLFTHPEEDLISEVLISVHQRLPRIKISDGEVDANLYRDAYDAEIRYCDKYVGDLLSKLEDLGLREIIIIITADHGESLGEHNYYFEHGKFVYDICSRVPLLIYVPGLKRSPPITQQVNIMNITPTILDLLGYPIPRQMEGVSLLPLMKGEASLFDEHIFIERRNEIKGVRTNNWKYINNIYCDSEELYYLKEDPGEEKNIIAENRAVAKGLKDVLSQWMNANDGITEEKLEEMRLKEEDKRALRALGYLQ